MDFTLTPEQRMLADTVGRFIDRDYDFESRRKWAASERGWSERNWATMADMGLLMLNVPESYGGMGGSAIETLIVMEALGRGLVVEPYLSTAVLGASAIAQSGTESQKRALLPRFANGSTRAALATLEPHARFDLWDIATTAKRSAGGYVLQGRKGVVLHGDSADVLIVSARTSAAQTDRDGITLFLVDVRAPGVTVRGFPALDGQRVAEIFLADVAVGADAVIGTENDGYPWLEWIVDRGLFALCAEAVGAMSRLADITYDHLRTRKQFGVPIGSFQALRHRVADIVTAVEQARSITYCAASRIDADDPGERRRTVSAAKALVGRCGRFVGQQAVQLHGGMGMTGELAVGWYLKRLTCIDMTWGNTEHHVELFGGLS